MSVYQLSRGVDDHTCSASEARQVIIRCIGTARRYDGNAHRSRTASSRKYWERMAARERRTADVARARLADVAPAHAAAMFDVQDAGQRQAWRA